VLTDTPVLSEQTPGEARSTKNHSGGLYIDSYPPGMTIVVDNKKLVWKTPQTVYGLREGLHTIRVEESDSDGKREDSGYQFEALQAWVYPRCGRTGPPRRPDKPVQEDHPDRLRDLSGREVYGERSLPAGTIPGDAAIEGAKSWITVFWNGTYRSHAIPPGHRIR